VLAPRYHRGEIEVQARAGVREMAARISDVIRPEIPLYTRDFLEDQRRWLSASPARVVGFGRRCSPASPVFCG
jgi:hypothetical protein